MTIPSSVEREVPHGLLVRRRRPHGYAADLGRWPGRAARRPRTGYACRLPGRQHLGSKNQLSVPSRCFPDRRWRAGVRAAQTPTGTGGRQCSGRPAVPPRLAARPAPHTIVRHTPVTNPKRRIPMRPTLRLLSRPSAAACVLTVALLPIAGCGSKSSTSDANETAASTVSIAPRRSDRRTRTRSRRQACSSARAVLSASRTRPTRTTRSRASPTQGSARRRSRRTRRSPHVLHDGYLHVQQHRASGSNTVGDR